MERMGTDRSNTIFVGDQLFTDVYGAKRTGIRNILVKPIHPKEEIQIVFKRKLEKIVLYFYEKEKRKQKNGWKIKSGIIQWSTVEKTILSERFLDTSAVMQSSAIGSILAGICIELGMNMLGVHPTIMRILTCILIAFTLLKNDLRNMYGEDYGVKYAGR